MIKIDTEKCTKCGLCASDCTTGALILDENNFPHLKNEEKCMKCQHCFMICPKGAITFNDKNPENSEISENVITQEQFLNLIKQRRSIRKFKPINVSKEKIEKLKDMLKYCPTGCNNHKLHFSIIEDIEVMDDFRFKVNEKLKKLFNKEPIKFFINKVNKFSKYKDDFLNGVDVIYRQAPHMIVVSAPISAPCPQQDGIISLSYFELYANAMSLGTLWCGFAQGVLKMFPEFCEYLKIPKNYIPIYCMLFGEKDINYQRTVQPENFDFTVVEKQDIKISFIEKLKRTFTNSLR